jgi:hypothetical protein
VTLTRSAMVACDMCFAILTIEGFAAHFPELFAASKGWRRDTHGHHFCRNCVDEGWAG